MRTLQWNDRQASYHPEHPLGSLRSPTHQPDDEDGGGGVIATYLVSKIQAFAEIPKDVNFDQFALRVNITSLMVVMIVIINVNI